MTLHTVSRRKFLTHATAGFCVAGGSIAGGRALAQQGEPGRSEPFGPNEIIESGHRFFGILEQLVQALNMRLADMRGRQLARQPNSLNSC